MALYQIKDRMFLGQAPTHIAEADILDYFMYVFEFTWTYDVFQQYGTKLKDRYKEKLDSLLNKQPLNKEVQWWALVLFSLYDISVDSECFYSIETIRMLLGKIGNLSESDLERYCNDINGALDDEMCDILAIRPIELRNLKSDAIEDDETLKYFLDNKEKFISILSKRLLQKDTDKEYLKQFMVFHKGGHNKFTDFWTIFYETFLGYYLSVASYVEIYLDEHVGEDVEPLIKKLNLSFFVASVKNKLKIDKVNQEISELILQFYKEQ